MKTMLNCLQADRAETATFKADMREPRWTGVTPGKRA